MSSITAAKKEVKGVLNQSNMPQGKQKHGAYEHFTLEEKAKMGKRAAECGVTTFSLLLLQGVSWPTAKGKQCPNMEDEVYLQEIAARKITGEDMTVNQLTSKKTARR